MRQTDAPELVEGTIVISDARKEQLAAALSDARSTMDQTAQTAWEPYVETPAEKRANARAQRIAWLIESL